MAFAENLQYLRKAHKMTQEELADALQVSRQSVSKWENGEAYPETEKLIALCNLFDVSLDALVRGDLTAEAPSAPATPADSHPEEPPSEELPEGSKRERLMNALGNSFGGLIMLGCVAAYLCMGFFADLWHPGWLVFLGGVTLCIIVGSIFGNDGEDEEHRGNGVHLNFKARLFGGLAGASMMAAVTIYLSLGFTLGIWHPGWVIFVAGGALAGVFGALAKYFGKN